MSFITTSLVTAACIDVGQVRFHRASDDQHVFATQKITVTLEDGQGMDLSIHLAEGTTALATGEAVVFPSLDEVPA